MNYILKNRYISSLLVSAGLSGSYITYREQVRYKQMCRTFQSGAVLYPSVENDPAKQYIQRPKIESMISKVLSPEETGRYYVIRGEVGCGKTRTTVEIVRNMMKNNGSSKQGAPIYLLASSGDNFVDTLAEAVSFKFDEHLNFKFLLESVAKIRSLPSKESHTKLSRALHAIEKAAVMYREVNGRPAVIVIDGIDWLTEQMPGALQKLQEKAKLWADANIVKVVFLSSDESTEKVLQSKHEEWSRAAAPVYINDLTRDEAMKILNTNTDEESHRKFTHNEMERIFGEVGYRVLHLLDLKQDRKDQIPLDDSIVKAKAKEKTKLRFVTFSPHAIEILILLQKAGEEGVRLDYFESKEASLKIIKEMTAANIVCSRKDLQSQSTRVRLESKLTHSVITDYLKEKNILK